jgi:hypothetical protein
MKQKSKQQPAGRSCEVGQPCERVPVTAARIFSNYVLVFPARRPDKGEPKPRLHGSALLVFADQGAEQLQLRTGYATHIAGDPALRPREDIRNEIMSGHEEQPPALSHETRTEARKESKMTREMHCTACHSDLQPGNQFCPGWRNILNKWELCL